jgi:hypothetical protein
MLYSSYTPNPAYLFSRLSGKGHPRAEPIGDRMRNVLARL